MSEFALKFVVTNLAASTAILLVLILRKPARKVFGPRLAYALWLLVPLAALASLLPPSVVETIRAPMFVALAPEVPAAQPSPFAPSLSLPPAPEATTSATAAFVASPRFVPNPPPSQPFDWTLIAALVWLTGAIGMALWQLRGQSRFMADARAGFAGPAVAGFIRPRIITPADFESRFDTAERNIILEHETIHLDRNDARTNALIALTRCLVWYNPLVHLAAHLIRIDQELACDAAVVARHPREKSVYASALLKAQLASRSLPLGCYWPARSEHPLTERIEMLKQPHPGRARRIAGVCALAIVTLAGGLAAWAAIPPEQRIIDAPVQQAAVRSQPIDMALSRAPIEAALPALDAPAPAPEQPPAAQPAATQIKSRYPEGYDGADSLTLRGKVERIDFADTTYIAYVRTTDFYIPTRQEPQADTNLWQLTPMPYWGDRDAVSRDILNQPVNVRGVRSTDKTCSPNCRIAVEEFLKCSVQPTFARGCAGNIPRTPPPELLPMGAGRFVVQPRVGDPWGSAVKLDANTPIYLRGKVEKIDFHDTNYVVYLRATSVTSDYHQRGQFGPPGQPDAALWELSPTSLFGDPDAVRADLMNKSVEVRGININAACKPNCRIKVKDLVMPRSTAVPAPQADNSMIAEFARWYDTSVVLSIISGTVERIDFQDRTFDAYIRLTDDPSPGRMYQLRSEYHFPRADIEKALLNQQVTASGWPARAVINTFCAPICGLYAATIQLPWRVTVAPAGPQLLVTQPGYENFMAVADLNAPASVTGKIVRLDGDANATDQVIWIEATKVDPVTAQGAQPGTHWRVVGYPSNLPFPRAIGGTATVRGFLAKDKTCQPTCTLASVGTISWTLPN